MLQPPDEPSEYFQKGDHAMTSFEIQSVLRTIPGFSSFNSLDDIRRKPAVHSRQTPKKKDALLKALAEAVILQAMEDLWSDTHRKESLEFFEGEGFGHCADLAGMRVVDRLKLIRMLRRLNAAVFKTRHSKKVAQFRTA
jgi:hypothetical protein